MSPNNFLKVWTYLKMLIKRWIFYDIDEIEIRLPFYRSFSTFGIYLVVFALKFVIHGHGYPSKHINVEIWLKKKAESTYVYRRCFNVDKQRRNNVDRVTLIQCWWPNVVSTLILGWKGKLSQRMLISVEKVALKQFCQ